MRRRKLGDLRRLATFPRLDISGRLAQLAAEDRNNVCPKKCDQNRLRMCDHLRESLGRLRLLGLPHLSGLLQIKLNPYCFVLSGNHKKDKMFIPKRKISMGHRASFVTSSPILPRLRAVYTFTCNRIAIQVAYFGAISVASFGAAA